MPFWKDSAIVATASIVPNDLKIEGADALEASMRMVASGCGTTGQEGRRVDDFGPWRKLTTLQSVGSAPSEGPASFAALEAGICARAENEHFPDSRTPMPHSPKNRRRTGTQCVRPFPAHKPNVRLLRPMW